MCPLLYHCADAVINEQGNYTILYKIGHNNYSVNKLNHKTQISKQGRPAVFDYICSSLDYLMLSNWMLVKNGSERI